MLTGRRALTGPVNAPAEIVRGRLLRSIAGRADRPVRFLCAPAGSGKTTLLRQYVSLRERARYIHVSGGMTASELRGALADAADASEILVDDLDAAEPAAVEAVIGAIAAGEGGYPPLILAGRAPGRLHVQKLLARGLGVVFDGSDLAFNHHELENLADLFEISHGHDDVTELLQVTEGWAVALTWIMREASSARAGLRGAFERWSDRHGHLLIEFVAESLDGDAALRQLFSDSIGADSRGCQSALAELELAGCPITRLRTRMRPYRILHLLARARESEREATAASFEPLAMTLLGRFSSAIGGRQITFARRRDQNVLVFLALAKDGRATRDELLEAFWPGMSRSVASQGLRTTLSRLRRAIAEAAQTDVEKFLQVDVTVSLVLDHIVVDARRFVEHVELGRIEDARGDIASARRHFRTACGLYKNRLLTSEAIEAPLETHVNEYGLLFDSTLKRLTEISSAADAGEGEEMSVWLRSLRTTA